MHPMNPSIGRIVHVQQYEGGVKLGEPMAAIITRVWSATVVSLHVFREAADSMPLTSIGLDEGQIVNGWAWYWPPRA